MFKDLVRVMDAGFARLRNKAGEILSAKDWGDELDKPIVQVEGWVSLVMRERGKIVPGTRREGKNVWTNTGREFLSMLMSIQTAPTTGFRSDRVGYIGVGTGSQPSSGNVLSLVTPVEYVTGSFLATLDTPPTFPLTPVRTTVQYHRTFLENEITISPGSSVNISELGLFTNGSPTATPPYNPGTRDLTIANASQQAPVAYKSFDPVTKTDVLEFEVAWKISF
jgi:hypothetical protein